MSYIQLSIPPLPHYINSGEAYCSAGEGHAGRKDIGVFDLIVVTKGILYIQENNEKWQVKPGQALLLNPSGHHYSYRNCSTFTHFYWLHFKSSSSWRQIDEPQFEQSNSFDRSVKRLNEFTIHLPKFFNLANPERTYALMKSLLLMMDQTSETVRWREQTIFQELFQDIKDNEITEETPKTSSGVIAEKAALYLRENYMNEINYTTLEQALSYNRTYISRCMKKVFNCTPLDYLKNFRIDQAKLLLINSDLTIAEIAEKVGFLNPSYFNKCFQDNEKITPNLFRKRYRYLTTHRWDT